MKNPEILDPQTTYSTAIETAQLTTIHLINNNRIITDTDVYDEAIDSENGFGEFFFAGL